MEIYTILRTEQKLMYNNSTIQKLSIASNEVKKSLSKIFSKDNSLCVIINNTYIAESILYIREPIYSQENNEKATVYISIPISLV